MSWLDRILGRTAKSKAAVTDMTAEDAIAIVADYCAFLENGASLPGPGSVADVQGLPHPKARIKRALLLMLYATTDQQMRDHLKVGYLSLADWQEGVGSGVVGMRPQEWSSQGDLEQQATAILAQAEAMKRWAPVIQADLAQLQADLKSVGL